MQWECLAGLILANYVKIVREKVWRMDRLGQKGYTLKVKDGFIWQIMDDSPNSLNFPAVKHSRYMFIYRYLQWDIYLMMFYIEFCSAVMMMWMVNYQKWCNANRFSW